MSESQELALEILLDFFDAVEAGIPAARQRIKEKHKLEPELDFNKLFWEKKTGTKGEFEQTSERANQNCVLWQQLKTKLKENKDFCQHSGFKFWFDMQQETVIDRRKIG